MSPLTIDSPREPASPTSKFDKMSYTPPTQLIDSEKRFSPDFADWLQKSSLARAGLNYHLISVFGSQSTGKSTLLNALFGTDFNEMSAAKRCQTTKGIWIGKAIDAPILIFDVEGTDGRERGEELEFERKSALFTLAASEVFIVNIWESQVGLHQASNMLLLRLVIETNLQLINDADSKKHPKTLIFFVIRDFLGITPLQNLQEIVMTDLKKLWHEIAKPDHFQHSSLSDLFDFKFSALSNKILCSPKFQIEVNTLREAFFDKSNHHYLFKDIYKRQIPADGLPLFAKNVWEQIDSNKNLDLPKQHQLLAQFRCDEIANKITSDLQDEINEVTKFIEMTGSIHGYRTTLQKVIDKHLEQFDEDASRYDKDVYEKIRETSLHRWTNMFNTLCQKQLISLIKKAEEIFHSALTDKPESETNMHKRIEIAKEIALAQFDKESSLYLLSAAENTLDESRSILLRYLDEQTELIKRDEIRKIHGNIQRVSEKKIRVLLKDRINNIDQKFWEKLLTGYQDITKESIAKYDTLISSRFSLGDEDLKEEIDNIQKQSWKFLKNLVDEELNVDSLIYRLRLIFEDVFKHDSKGLPIIWSTENQIESQYLSAYERVSSLCQNLYQINITNDNLSKLYQTYSEIEPLTQDSDSHFFSPLQYSELKIKIKSIAESAFIDAKRSIIQTKTSIPIFIYVLLFVLGWNELLMIMRNPFLFTFVLFFGGGAYVLYILNLLGPAETVARNLAKDVLHQGLGYVQKISSNTNTEQNQPLHSPQLE